MATGRSNQLTRQIGEHLVAAELGRRGLIAAPFAGNVPLFDLLVADEEGHSIPIQVKTIRGASWQFDIGQFLEVDVVDGAQIVRGRAELQKPDLVCVFVEVRENEPDAFFLLYLSDLQEHFAQTYRDRRRPKNPESMHCAVWPKHLSRFRDNWRIVFESLHAGWTPPQRRLIVESAALLAAVSFAAEKHRHQRRKDPDASPYINHPIDVAEILARVGDVSDGDVLRAAILHDTLEDTETTKDELAEHFGALVADLVQEVSDDKSLPKEERKRLQILHAPALSLSAKLIKLGDKICNVRDVANSPPTGWNRKRRLDYFKWSCAVVAGCRGVNEKLEKSFDELIQRGEKQVKRTGAKASSLQSHGISSSTQREGESHASVAPPQRSKRRR